MKRVLISLLLLSAAILPAQLNNIRTCGTPVLPQQYEAWVNSLSLQQNPGKTGPSSTQSVFYIPVIVHVIHNNEPVNSISATSGNNLNAAQIIDQINILNKDYNGTNADTSLIPSVFKPFLGKFQINFCLAVVNPTGGVLAEAGIDRINRVAKGWSSFPYLSSYIDATVKPNSIWDPNKYLNIWVGPLGGGLLGYATFPNPGTSGLSGLTGSFGSTTTDGVVILNTSFGSVGTAQTGTYNKGRTATHEIGHWMGLRHIWGDANCGTDYCNDTPPAQAANYSCPSFPYHTGLCTGNTTGEMTMNYMDYTDDACMYMFTADQKNRAQLILTNSTMRASLISSTVCNLPTLTNDLGITYVAKPTYSFVTNCTNSLSPVVHVTNFGSTAITSALFTYDVDGLNTQTTNWTGSVAPGGTFTLALNPFTNLSAASHIFSVNVSAPNGSTDNNPINNSNSQKFYFTANLNVTAPSASTCAGNSVLLYASGASTYSWNTGSTLSSFSVSPSLTTVYTVTASLGSCVVVKTVSVTIQNAPILSVSPNAVCEGQSTYFTAAGANTYTWNNAQTGSGTYLTLPANNQLTVTGAFSSNCVSTQTFNILVNALPTATANAYYMTCSSCNDGSATAIAAGGTAPYTYVWMPGNLTGANVSGLAEGCYTVTVTDAKGCKTDTSTCVTFDTGIFEQSSTLQGVSLSPNPGKGLIKVDLNFSGVKNIEVWDLHGRLIRKKTTEALAEEIDITEYSNAVYYVRVTSNNKYFVGKVIKE